MNMNKVSHILEILTYTITITIKMLKSLIVTLDKMAWSIGSPDGTWKALFLDLELSQELTRKMNDMTTTYLLV